MNIYVICRYVIRLSVIHPYLSHSLNESIIYDKGFF